jgi:hypothetical protein
MGRVLNMFGMGGHVAAADLWSVCLICLGMGRPMGRVLNAFGTGRPMAATALWGLAWAALWLQPPYGACAEYVWHGPPYGCVLPTGRALNMFGMGRDVINMFGMGRPMAAAALWGVCLIRLAWAALWLRPPYGAGAQYVWHGPPYGCGRPLRAPEPQSSRAPCP